MITFETKYLRYSIDEFGSNVEFTEKATGRNILKRGFNPCGYLVKSESDRTKLYPVKAFYEEPYLTLVYEGNEVVRVLVGVHDDYLTFALKSVSHQNWWTIAAVCIAVDVDYTEDSSFVATLMGMSVNTRMQEYPGRNSLLLAEAYPHISIAGIKAAVIGAPENVLNGIMRTVLDEIPDGVMPKAAYSGPYACDCPDAARSYTITGGALTMANVDDYIAKMKHFGLSQVHLHQGGMYSQGDFTVNKDIYPNGIEDFKAVIAHLHENGIQAMLHSYTFFVQSVNAKQGNRYTAPIPHKDLGVCARFTLANAMTADTARIDLAEGTATLNPNAGYSIPETHLFWIDDEIIRWNKIDEKGVYEIERGTFGTVAAEHAAGSVVRQLNSYFGYIAPEKNSELFYEIARNNAEFYNECDFDGYYLDAIDGVFVLDGNEFSWYHAVEFINEMFKYQKKPPIFNCCYGPQYPGQWYARTRMGAFDTPHRGWRDFADAHVSFNEKFAERMYLIGELGWWSLYPGNNDRLGWQNKVMFDEDVDYICTKILATDVCQCWHGSFASYPDVPLLESYAGRIALYTRLRDEKYFPQSLKQQLRKKYSEFELVEKGSGDYAFRPTYTDLHKLESLRDDRASFTAVNRFAAQQPKIRLEGLYSAENYDCPDAWPLCAFDENVPVKFDEPYALNHFSTAGRRGVGVWVKGDGQGETLRIRLRSPEYVAHGNADYFVKVDFEGWKYFAFYEFENCEQKHDVFPPQMMEYKVFTDVEYFYAAYSSPVNFDDLESLTVTSSDGKPHEIYFRPVMSLPHREVVLENPTVTVGGKSVTFRTALKSNTFLEYDPATGKALVRDLAGFTVDTPAVEGEPITLESGENTVTLTADCGASVQPRAAVTLRTAGDCLEQ